MDLLTQLSTAVDSRIAGKTVASARRLFSVENYSTLTFEENVNWAFRDVTNWNCFALANTSDGGRNRRHGILVTPWHLLMTRHFGYTWGNTIWFWDRETQSVVTRQAAGHRGVYRFETASPDICIAVLNDRVPDSCIPLKIGPADWRDYAPYDLAANRVPIVKTLCGGDATWNGITVTHPNKITAIADLYSVATFQVPTNTTRLAWHEDAVSYDSGSPAYWLRGNAFELITSLAGGGAGSGENYASLIAEIGTLIDLSGNHGYTVEVADWSDLTKPDDRPPPTPPVITGPTGFLFAGNEGQGVTFSTAVDLAYGSNGNFRYIYNFTGSVTFNAATFGGDPNPGVTKYGFYKTAAGTSTPVDPLPDPNDYPPTEPPMSQFAWMNWMNNGDADDPGNWTVYDANPATNAWVAAFTTPTSSDDIVPGPEPAIGSYGPTVGTIAAKNWSFNPGDYVLDAVENLNITLYNDESFIPPDGVTIVQNGTMTANIDGSATFGVFCSGTAATLDLTVGGSFDTTLGIPPGNNAQVVVGDVASIGAGSSGVSVAANTIMLQPGASYSTFYSKSTDTDSQLQSFDGVFENHVTLIGSWIASDPQQFSMSWYAEGGGDFQLYGRLLLPGWNNYIYSDDSEAYGWPHPAAVYWENQVAGIQANLDAAINDLVSSQIQANMIYDEYYSAMFAVKERMIYATQQFDIHQEGTYISETFVGQFVVPEPYAVISGGEYGVYDESSDTYSYNGTFIVPDASDVRADVVYGPPDGDGNPPGPYTGELVVSGGGDTEAAAAAQYLTDQAAVIAAKDAILWPTGLLGITGNYLPVEASDVRAEVAFGPFNEAETGSLTGTLDVLSDNPKPADGTPQRPTCSGASQGETCGWSEGATVTLATASAGAYVFYSIDGRSLQPYTAPFVPPLPCTIRAYSVSGAGISDPLTVRLVLKPLVSSLATPNGRGRDPYA